MARHSACRRVAGASTNSGSAALTLAVAGISAVAINHRASGRRHRSTATKIRTPPGRVMIACIAGCARTASNHRNGHEGSMMRHPIEITPASETEIIAQRRFGDDASTAMPALGLYAVAQPNHGDIAAHAISAAGWTSERALRKQP